MKKWFIYLKWQACNDIMLQNCYTQHDVFTRALRLERIQDMKKLFNHTKKPTEDWKGYDENDFNWDESAYDEEEYAEEDGYYIEEEPEAFEEEEYYEEADGAIEPGTYEEAEYYGEEEGAVEPGAYEEAE